MRTKLVLAMMAAAGALLLSGPSSAAPVGPAGLTTKADIVNGSLTQEVRHRRRWHRRWHRRRWHRHRFYRPYYYYPYYSYYDPYYYPYYHRPYRYYRRPGFSFYFGY